MMTKTEFNARKEIASRLDRMADRATLAGASPATGKQCWFLAGLLLQNGYDVDYVDCGNTNYVLTKGRASRHIETLIS